MNNNVAKLFMNKDDFPGNVGVILNNTCLIAASKFHSNLPCHSLNTCEAVH